MTRFESHPPCMKPSIFLNFQAFLTIVVEITEVSYSLYKVTKNTATIIIEKNLYFFVFTKLFSRFR